MSNSQKKFSAPYPPLGTKVTYVRQDPQGQVLQGEAVVLAICLDQEKRVMAHIKHNAEGEGFAFNVDLNCLNPSEEFVEKFKDVTNRVRLLQGAANEEIQAKVADGNRRIADEYSTILGHPVNF